MKLAGLLIVFALTVAAAGHASAQGAARRVCDPDNSERTTITAIAADPGAWMGKCVSVEGIYSNERLYADGDAVYGLNGNSIGGYVDGQGDLTGFWNGRFTGRVSDCEKAEDDLLTGLLRSPGISLNYRTLGCLEPKGPFLVFMSQSNLSPSRLKRRLPGARGADLVVAPDNWEHAGEVARLAGEFVTALRGEDRQTLRQFIRSDYAIDQMIAGEGTAIDALKSSTQRKLQIFMHDASAPDAFESEACYCLTTDCSKRWPIARRDADNQKGRPYACLRIDGVRQGGAWKHAVDPSRDFDGLPEPR